MKRYILVLACCLALISTHTSAEEQEEPVIDLSAIEVLDMKTAQKLALQGNPDLVAAMARVEQARYRVEQAVAEWWPSVDVTALGAHQRYSDTEDEYNQLIASLYNSTADKTVDSFTLGLQATWTLFDGFYRSFNSERARYDQEGNQAALIDARRQLVMSVAEAFLNAQLAQTNVDIAKADKAFYTRQLEDAQNRYDVGAGAWGDVLNIKVQMNSAETNLMLSQREFEAAVYGLAALIGLEEATFPSSLRLESLDRNFAPAGFAEDIEELIDIAQAVRPDLQQLKAGVKQAEAGTGMAKAPFYPQVQLGGTVDGAREDDPGFAGDDIGNTVYVNVVWNLFSGGGDKAKLAEAKQAKREAQYSLANAKNLIAAEVRQNIAQLKAAEEQVRLQRESVKLVEENRDLAKNEYEAGEASLVRLNEAQRDLTTTYGRLAQSLVGYHRAKERLDASIGRNLESFELESIEQ